MVGWVASELFPFVENTFPTTFLQTVLASFPAHGFPVILNSTFDHHIFHELYLDDSHDKRQ